MNARQAAQELQDMDWMEEYGKEVEIQILDHEAREFNICYEDQWGRKWNVPITYSGDKGFYIDLGDAGSIDLHPAGFWAYLFVEAANEVEKAWRKKESEK